MLKKVLFNGLAYGIVLITGLISSIVLTRHLGPVLWGYYGQVTWVAEFGAALFGFGLTATATRFLAFYSKKEDQADGKNLFIWITGFQLVVSLVGAVLTLLFAGQILTLTGWQITATLLRIGSFGIFSLAMLNLGMAMLRGLQEYKTLSILTVILGVLTMFVVVVTLIASRVEVLVAATIASQMIVLPWLFWKISHHFKNARSFSIGRTPGQWQSILRYNFFIFLSVLADQIVWQKSEIYFLAQLKDSTQSGFYSLAFTIAQTSIIMIASALVGVLIPIFTSSFSQGGLVELSHEYTRAFSYINLCVLPLGVGLFIIAPNLIQLMYGNSYLGVVPVLRIVIISTAIGLYAKPSQSFFHALNRPEWLLVASLFAIPVDLLSAWKLVPIWGAIGAAVANLSAQVLAASILIGRANFSHHLEYNWRSILNGVLAASACGSIAWIVLNYMPVPIFNLTLAVLGGVVSYSAALILLGDKTAIDGMLLVKNKLHLPDILKIYPSE